MSAATAARTGIFGRVWAAYLRVLEEHPLRTKMGTSGFMFLLGDSIAQFGIEGRRPFGSQPAVEDEEDSPEWNVSLRQREAALCQCCELTCSGNAPSECSSTAPVSSAR